LLPLLLLAIAALSVAAVASSGDDAAAAANAESPPHATTPPLLPPTLIFDFVISTIGFLLSLVTSLLSTILLILLFLLKLILLYPFQLVLDLVWGWIPLLTFFGTASCAGIFLGGLAGVSVEEFSRGSSSEPSPLESKSEDGEKSSISSASWLVPASSAAKPYYAKSDLNDEDMAARMRTETMDTYATQRLTGLPPARLRRLMRGQFTSPNDTFDSGYGDDHPHDEMEEEEGWNDILSDMTPSQVNEFLERISKSSEKTEEMLQSAGGGMDEVESLDLGMPATTEEVDTTNGMRRRDGYGVATH